MPPRGVSILDLGPAALAQVKDQLLAQIPIAKKAGKYRNNKTTYKNRCGVERVYDSKKEADYAAMCDQRVVAGALAWWIPQIVIPLPGGVFHRIDFLLCHISGAVEFVEIKGYDAPMGKAKRKLVEAIYGIKITVI